MSEGTDQYTVELDESDGPASLEDDDLVETNRDHTHQDPASGESGVSSTDDASLVSRFLSPLSLALVLVSPFLFTFFVGMIPLLPGVLTTVTGAAIGLFAGGFSAGLVREANQYSESVIGGAIIGVLTAWTTSNSFELSVLGVGLLLGVVLALAGAYFGGDLRSGLTKEIG